MKITRHNVTPEGNPLPETGQTIEADTAREIV